MLNSLLFSFFFKKSVKTGFYIDFLTKRVSLYFLRNQFNWVAVFLLEKFVIEYLARFIYSRYFLGANIVQGTISLNYVVIIYPILYYMLLV
jgi:hypothetical protein